MKKYIGLALLMCLQDCTYATTSEENRDVQITEGGSFFSTITNKIYFGLGFSQPNSKQEVLNEDFEKTIDEILDLIDSEDTSSKVERVEREDLRLEERGEVERLKKALKEVTSALEERQVVNRSQRRVIEKLKRDLELAREDIGRKDREVEGLREVVRRSRDLKDSNRDLIKVWRRRYMRLKGERDRYVNGLYGGCVVMGLGVFGHGLYCYVVCRSKGDGRDSRRLRSSEDGLNKGRE